MTKVPIAVDQGGDLSRCPALGAFRNRAAMLQPDIKPLEENLPFTADRIRVVEVLLILGIQKIEVQCFGLSSWPPFDP